MVTHASENARIGLQARELADAGIQGVAARGDQVAGHQGEVRPQAIGGIHHARQVGFAEESAEVNVAQLHEPEALQIRGQSGQREIHFAHAEIQAFDERSVTDGRYGSRYQQLGGGFQQTPAARIGAGPRLFSRIPRSREAATRAEATMR